MNIRIELAVFDMAGTTVSEGGAVYKALQDTLAAIGVDVDAAAIHGVKGTDKREALRTLVEQSPLSDALLPRMESIHEDFIERLLAFYRSDASVGEVPGASDAFRRLKANGVKVALNTGFNRVVAQTLIDRMRWERDGLIDDSITSDEVERGRPHPFMIRALMQRLGVDDPGCVVKTGDAPSDLLEGKNAGCGLVVGVTRGSSTREQLAVHPHDHLIDTVADLPGLLGL
jgi:phosphonatase-like hydrolase